MKSRLYVETSVISYLAARPSRDLIVAAHQQITHEWWDIRRFEFDLSLSQLVLTEAKFGDPGVAAARLQLLQGIPLLDIHDEVAELAQQLLSAGYLPRKAAQDAIHIAIAAIHGMDYLLTWNCKHIANAHMRPRIERLIHIAGYHVPVIATPEELPGE